MRFLLAFAALLLSPFLLAPVRLKDASPDFFQPLSQSPAPESYSLPAAEPLITPTVIPVSPTLMPYPSPTVPPVSSTLSLPLPPSPTVSAPQVKSITILSPDTMSATSSALCQRGMVLVQNLAMLSYQAKPNQKLMNIGLATAATARQAAAGQWPDMTAFDNATGNLPWFQPQMDELKQAIPMTRRLCMRGSMPETSSESHSILGF